MSKIREQTIKGLAVNDTFSVSRKFTEEDMTAFADITRDYNPVHFDDRFARAKNFKGRICHGLLAGSMLTEIGGQIGWLATGMDFSFKKPAYFDDTITCTMTIVEIDDRGRAKAKVGFTNQKGILVIEALITGWLPGSEDLKILSAMVAEGDPTNKIEGENV